MMQRKQKHPLIWAMLGLLLLLAWHPGAANADTPGTPTRPVPQVPPRPVPEMPPRPGLPPRPDDPPKPTPTPSSPIFHGGLIELCIRFEANWPWDIAPWQKIDTLVQWQDGEGTWHNIDTWHGILDQITGTLGRKSWFVTEDHFGSGPFRWAIYTTYSDPIYSASFNMPEGDGQIVRVWADLDAP